MFFNSSNSLKTDIKAMLALLNRAVSGLEGQKKEIEAVQASVLQLEAQMKLLSDNVNKLSSDLAISLLKGPPLPPSKEESKPQAPPPSYSRPTSTQKGMLLDPQHLLSLFNDSFASSDPEAALITSLKTAGFRYQIIKTSEKPLDRGWHECGLEEGTVVLVMNPLSENGFGMPLPDSFIETGVSGRLFNFSGSIRAAKQSITTLPVLSRNPTGSWSMDQPGTLAQDA